MKAHRTTRGFTILEALVAVAILGTAVSAGMSVISTSLRNAARIVRMSAAPDAALDNRQSKQIRIAGRGQLDPLQAVTGAEIGGQVLAQHALGAVEQALVDVLARPLQVRNGTCGDRCPGEPPPLD